MLNLDPGIMIWAWFTFIVLLLILYKFAWKPILSTIDQRENKIRDSMERAEKAKEEAEALLEEHKKKMDAVESEAQKIIRQNQEIAEKTRNDLINKAKNEAKSIIEKAKQEINNERESALFKLKADVADLVISTTKSVIGDILDEAKHRELVDDYIKKMPDLH